MDDVIREAFQLVDERSSVFDPEEVRRILREMYRTKDKEIEALVQGVLEEARKRAVQATRNLWACFGLPLPEEVENHLWRGGAIDVYWGSTGSQVEEQGRRRKKKEIKAAVRLADKAYFLKEISFVLLDDRFSGGRNVFDASPGRVLYKWSRHYTGLQVLNERAFFRVASEDMFDGVLRSVRALRPFFAGIGQGELDVALDELAQLKDGETATKSDYILAKEGHSWFLWRGSVTGDAFLDGALLAGREVNLTFPGDVEITLKVDWRVTSMTFYRMRIYFEGEEVDLGDGEANIEGYPLYKDPIVRAIQSKLRREINRYEYGMNSRFHELSVRMVAFLKALSKHEEPFKALAEGRFCPYATTEFFLEF
jgi:hypothetical protein